MAAADAATSVCCLPLFAVAKVSGTIRHGANSWCALQRSMLCPLHQGPVSLAVLGLPVNVHVLMSTMIVIRRLINMCRGDTVSKSMDTVAQHPHNITLSRNQP